MEVARSRGAGEFDRILAELEQYDQLYRPIAEHGYRSQFELGGTSYLSSLCQEVRFDIGRPAEILFVDGRHRLSIAKLLGIPKIPGRVLVRHQQWMEQRDALMDAGRPNDHPDLRN